jgi:hypothetical protein
VPTNGLVKRRDAASKASRSPLTVSSEARRAPTVSTGSVRRRIVTASGARGKSTGAIRTPAVAGGRVRVER